MLKKITNFIVTTGGRSREKAKGWFNLAKSKLNKKGGDAFERGNTRLEDVRGLQSAMGAPRGAPAVRRGLS